VFPPRPKESVKAYGSPTKNLKLIRLKLHTTSASW
jgi:hypothetical protein